MMSRSCRICAAVVLCFGILLPVLGGTGENPEAPGVEAGFLKYFEYEPLDVQLDAPRYELPLDPGLVVEFNQTASRMMLKEEARERLLETGFVVTEFPFDRRSEQFDEAYLVLEQRDVPILVTSSSLLHAFHIIFDHTLDLHASVFYLFNFTDVGNEGYLQHLGYFWPNLSGIAVQCLPPADNQVIFSSFLGCLGQNVGGSPGI